MVETGEGGNVLVGIFWANIYIFCLPLALGTKTTDRVDSLTPVLFDYHTNSAVNMPVLNYKNQGRSEISV